MFGDSRLGSSSGDGNQGKGVSRSGKADRRWSPLKPSKTTSESTHMGERGENSAKSTDSNRDLIQKKTY